MHPILFEIGPIQIPTYGSILVVAFLLCAFLMKREAKRLNLPGQKMVDLAVVTLLFGLLGAKLLLIIVDFPDYLADPKRLVSTLRAAGVLYGGILGGVAAAAWYVRRHKLPVVPVMDLFSPFLALGIGLGRLGCFSAGCCYGIPYEGFLALHFPQHPYCEAPPEMGLFPIQLLSCVNGIVLFFILLAVLRRSKRQGTTALLFFTLYPVTRGLLEFLRGDSLRGIFFNTLSTSQLISFGVLLVVAGVFFVVRRKRARRE